MSDNSLDTENFYTLVLKKDGSLWENEWVYDEEKGEGNHIPKDITADPWHRKDRYVKFEDGVTLNDVFKFVSTDPEIWDMVCTNSYVVPFIDKWKTIESYKPAPSYSPDEIEYLELYWVPELSFDDNGKYYIDGVNRSCFHGIGFLLKEDKKDRDYVMYHKGNRIHWGIDFSQLEDLLGLPIRINEKFELRDDFALYADYRNVPILVDAVKKMTLQEVVEGIFWELSFYGCQNEKDEKKAELDGIMDDLDMDNNSIDELIEQGKVKPIDDLFLRPIRPIQLQLDL